jgi:Na+/H+-dicarboxylate symporter
MSGYEKIRSTEKDVKVSPMFMSPFIIFSIVMAIIIFRDEEKIGLVKKLLTNKMFFISLMAIIGFSVYNLKQTGGGKEMYRRKRATREAVLGFIIAIMAYLDLKAAPFWVIFVVSYYYE